MPVTVLSQPVDAGTGLDELTKISENDTTSDYLDNSITPGVGIATTILNPSADETLEISLDAGLNDLNDVTITMTGSPPIATNSRLHYDASIMQWINAPGVAAPPPGGELYVQLVWNRIGTLSGTAIIPRDDTPPLITEGLELWNNSITPTDSQSTIRISSSFTWFDTNASSGITISVFRNNICVGVSEDTVSDNNHGQTVHFVIFDNPSTTSPITYSVRVGISGSGPGTFYINSHPSITNLYGGLMENNAYSIEEIGVVL